MKNIFKSYQGLHRSIYYIFIGQIVNSMGAFVFPFLTLFLTDKLGYSTAFAGNILTIAMLLHLPGMLIGAQLADKYKRKRIYLITASLKALMLIPPAFLGTKLISVYFIMLMSLFAGAIGPVFHAMISDLTAGEERKKAFSLLYLGWNAGYAIGPMLAGFLFNNFLPFLFLGDVLTTLIAIILVAKYVPETSTLLLEKEKHDQIPDLEKAEAGSLLHVLYKRPVIIGFSLIMLFYRIAYAQVSFSLPLQLKEIFQATGPGYYGMLMSFNALIVVVFTVFVTGMTVKYKPLINIVLAGFLFAIGFGMIYYIDHLILFFISTFIWTIGEILEATNSNVYIANHSPSSHRARINSFYMIISNVGMAFSPKISGYFIEYISLRAIWRVSAMITILAALFFYILHSLLERKNKEGKNG